MKKIALMLLCTTVLSMNNVFAQLPNCTGNPATIIYIHSGGSIYNYDVTQPASATNPILNTIPMPSGGGGLAVANNLNGPGPSPTFYTTVSGNYWYYNGTTWVNTGHAAGPGTGYVNPGGGGNYIHNYTSGGNISQYDGTGNATLLLNVPGFGSGGPYDIVGHCDGGFYVLKTVQGTPSPFLRKYDPNGNLVSSWPATGTSNTAGGGFAIVNNTVYYHNGGGFRFAPFTLPSTNLAFTNVGVTIPSPSDMACCRVCDSLINVPPPKAQFGMSSDTICAGEMVSFTDLSTDTPTFWNWTFPTGTPPTSTAQNPSNVVFNTPGSHTIRLIASNAGGSDTQTHVLIVNPVPAASITGDSLICSGETATLIASPSSGVSYSWSSTGLTQSITVSPNVTTTYSVVVSNGFCSDTAQFTVNVTAQPVASITGKSEICLGESTVLTANPTGISYLWSTADMTPTITVSPTSTTTYGVITTNGNCSDSATFTLFVNPLPDVSASATLTNCDANTGTATAVGSLGTPTFNYSWTGGLTGSTISSLGVGNYIVTVTDSKNCTATTAVNVGMHPNPVAVINPYPIGHVRIGENIQLNASGGNQYVWNPSTYLSCDQCPDPVSAPKEDIVNYCVKVIDVNGCEDTACTTIMVDTSCSYIFIPNAFTPNNDGLNDLISVSNTCIIDKLVFSIFNRWGQKVFESKDVNEKWDGTYNGVEQPTSTFFYYLEAHLINGRIVQQRGDITLIR